jgi:uncharacterized protein
MSIPTEQQEVAHLLSTLSASEPTETQISAVFVGRDTVWKLKKAVQLPFLDFSTVAARHHFLTRELSLNQPAAPEIYRDVVAVVRQPDGTLALSDDPGQAPVDWVLRMAPVPKQDFLDVIASNGPLRPALLDALGDCVVRYHTQCPRISDWDSAGALQRAVDGNARDAVAAGLPRGQIEDWQQRITAAVQDLRPWLDARSAAGFVRRGHGDLHLGNICLWDGAPVPFDALEFDEALATVDAGFDLAFLLMDLDRRVDRAAANRVMNRAMARSGDAGATQGFPLFLSLRAMVRGHVSAASGQTKAALAYLAAALAYLTPPPAFVLAIGGLPGTGKSTVARRLAPALGAAPGAVIVRSDEIRKRQHGVAPETRLPPEAYSDAANTAVNAELLDLGRRVAAGGHAVILDAAFLDRGMRDAAAPFLGVWLQVPLPELERRIRSRRNDASDATLDVLHRMAAVDTGPMDWMTVDATDTDAAVKVIRQAVEDVSRL